jgi:hypothetical protein
VTGRDVRGQAAVVVVAATGSALPSTLLTLVRGEDLTESTRAAGTLVLGDRARPGALLAAGALTHLAIATGWVTILARVLPRHRRPWWGAAAGLGIAALDLGIIGRRFPRIRRLRAGAQVADHIAFGLLTGWALDRVEVVHGAEDGAGTLRAS